MNHYYTLPLTVVLWSQKANRLLLIGLNCTLHTLALLEANEFGSCSQMITAETHNADRQEPGQPGILGFSSNRRQKV